MPCFFLHSVCDGHQLVHMHMPSSHMVQFVTLDHDNSGFDGDSSITSLKWLRVLGHAMASAIYAVESESCNNKICITSTPLCLTTTEAAECFRGTFDHLFVGCLSQENLILMDLLNMSHQIRSELLNKTRGPFPLDHTHTHKRTFEVEWMTHLTLSACVLFVWPVFNFRVRTISSA